MKKTLTILLIFLSVNILFSKSIIIGIYENYPLVFTEKGNIKGIYPEIIENIFKRNNIKYEFKTDTFSNHIENLREGKIDLLVDIIKTNERENFLDYNSESFLTNWGQLYVNSFSNINSITDLTDKKIGVVKEDGYYKGEDGIKYLSDKFGVKTTFIEYEDYEDVFLALKEKKLDAGVVSRIYGYYSYNKYDLKPTAILLNPQNLYVAVKKGENKEIISLIDNEINKMKNEKNSFFTERINYWLDESNTGISQYLKTLSLLVIILILGIVLTYIISEIKIKNKTKELASLNAELEIEKNKLQKIIDLLPDMVYVKNYNGKILLANKKYKEFFKQDDNSMEELNSKFFKLFNEDIMTEFIRTDRIVIEKKEIVSIPEDIAYDSEGNVKYFKTVKIPLEGTENTVHVLGVSSDITEVKNAYTKINEQNQILESSLSQIKASNEELESLYTENQDLITKIENIIYIMESVFKYENIDDFLKVIFNKIFDFIPEADYGSLWKLNGDSIFYLETKGHDKEKLNSAGLKAENFIIEKEIIIKDNILEYDENYPDLIKNSKKIKKTLLIPILSKDKFYGNFALDLDESNPERFKEDSLRFAKYISNLISLIFSLRESNKAHQVMQEDIIFSLVKMIEFHDEYTKGHSENVAHFSRLMARNMNFDEDKINEIYWSAIIHDVGKLFIDKNILNKPNRLTKDEFNEIKKHPVYAYNILKEISSMENIARYIKYHHERYDGSGYPQGLKNNEIPLESRIMTIADSWDAMTRDRIYRKALSKEEAIEELVKNKGVQFDPDLVEIFINIVK